MFADLQSKLVLLLCEVASLKDYIPRHAKKNRKEVKDRNKRIEEPKANRLKLRRMN